MSGLENMTKLLVGYVAHSISVKIHKTLITVGFLYDIHYRTGLGFSHRMYTGVYVQQDFMEAKLTAEYCSVTPDALCGSRCRF